MDSLQLLLRFDDICPEMNHGVWEKIKDICEKSSVKPLIAVIPDNTDPKFTHEKDPGFWEDIRNLQALGWGIALHGLHHVCGKRDGGLLKINDKSEFAGYSYKEQSKAIKKGLAIFASNGITADAWIAPSHSFDDVTLRVLGENNIFIISDGFYDRPVRTGDFIWIPSRLWERNPVPAAGFYTICHHFDRWNEDDIAFFSDFIDKYKNNIISLSDVLSAPLADITRRDHAVNARRVRWMYIKRKIKKLLKR